MKLTGGRVESFLRDPPRDTLGALVYGSDRGLVRERVQALSARFVQDPADAFAVTRLTTDDLSDDPARLFDSITAMSLLGDASLVVFRLDHERGGKAVADIIRRFDAEPHLAASRLVIEAGEMKTGSAVRKAVEASARFAALPCYPDGSRDVSAIITATLEENGLSIRPDALAAWMERLDADRALIRSEVEKMVLYMGPGPRDAKGGRAVTVEDVLANTAGAQSSTYDDIIASVMGGEVREADSAIRRAVAGKTSPVAILLALQRHLLRLMEASSKAAAGMGQEQALKSLRPPVWPSQMGVYTSQLRRWSPGALQNALGQALDVETEVKTAGAPAESLVSRYALALASFAAGRG